MSYATLSVLLMVTLFLNIGLGGTVNIAFERDNFLNYLINE